jgi:predicted HTH transcriptional regulator
VGAILFAKRLNDFDRLARKAPRVVVYDGTSKLQSGIDKVIQAVEDYQLPAPDFRVGERRTTAVLFGQDMNRNDRIRACYQHCCLRYVMNEQMTNQSLRERFKLPESKSATVSQIIAATMKAGKSSCPTRPKRGRATGVTCPSGREFNLNAKPFARRVLTQLINYPEVAYLRPIYKEQAELVPR